MLSCCKCLFEYIGAKLAHIQPRNIQCPKNEFLANVLGVNELISDQSFQEVSLFVINLGNLSKASAKTPGIPQNLDSSWFFL